MNAGGQPWRWKLKLLINKLKPREQQKSDRSDDLTIINWKPDDYINWGKWTKNEYSCGSSLTWNWEWLTGDYSKLNMTKIITETAKYSAQSLQFLGLYKERLADVNNQLGLTQSVHQLTPRWMAQITLGFFMSASDPKSKCCFLFRALYLVG